MSSKKIFQPANLGKLKLKNRVVMEAMSTGFDNPDGTKNSRWMEFHRRAAEGGAGIILTGATAFTCVGSPFADPRVINYGWMPSLSEFTELIHRYGTKVGMQLKAGYGYQGSVEAYIPKTPSPVPAFQNPKVMTEELTKNEIETIIKDAARGASIAKMSGFDLVELRMHTGYLVDNFLTESLNFRTDEYGGSFKNRLRFATEFYQSVRAALGPDIPISVRISGDHKITNGRSLEETIKICQYFESIGVNILNIDGGSWEARDYLFVSNYVEDAPFVGDAKKIKEAVNIPVIVAGKLTPEIAIDIVENGTVDFVGFGRQFIADPSFVNKSARKDFADIRRCINCNQYCDQRVVVERKTLGCSVNPLVGKGAELELKPVRKAKKVSVIGGGPAGLEAARVAAERGHYVTLYEKQQGLGGMLRAAATPTFKKGLRDLVKWEEKQLNDLGVEVKLNAEITPEKVKDIDADVVVYAVGATPIRPNIPGIDGDNIVDVVDSHLNKHLIKGENIAFAGGGLSACDAALELALEGKKVTIIEMLGDVAAGLAKANKISLMRLLKKHGATILTNHIVKEFTGEGILCENADGEIVVKSDTAVIAFGLKLIENGLYEALSNHIGEVYLAGDSMNIAKVGEAIMSGYAIGNMI